MINRKTMTKIQMVHWGNFKVECIEMKDSMLITGSNGVGKTTILDALSYLLAGNKRFNQNSDDKGRGRDVIGYVRGDLKSEGGPRYLRNGNNISSYVMAEFYSELDERYFVIGVSLEYASEKFSEKWFVLKDTKIDDIKCYERVGNSFKILPKEYVTVKGVPLSSSDLMPIKKGLEQVKLALGVRCSVEKYKNKLVKMMFYKAEDNINAFIKNSVLDEKPNESIQSIREHRQHYEELVSQYDHLEMLREQLREIDAAATEYEAQKEKCDIGALFMAYQTNATKEKELAEITLNIQDNDNKLMQLELESNKTKDDRENALEWLQKSKSNQEFLKIEDAKKRIKAQLKENYNQNKALDIELTKLNRLERNLDNLSKELQIDVSVYDVLNHTDSVHRFIVLKNEIEKEKDVLNASKYEANAKKTDVANRMKQMRQEIAELEKGRVVYPSNYVKDKSRLEKALEKRGVYTQVRFFVELIESVSPEWQLTIENFLKNRRFNLIVEPKYVPIALQVIQEENLYNANVIATNKLAKSEVKDGSAASMLKVHNKDARAYANYLLNNMVLCNTLEELNNNPLGGMTKDGMIAAGYTIRKNNVKNETLYIGSDAIERRKKQLEEELLQEKLMYDQVNELYLKNSHVISQIDAIDWREDGYVFDAKAKQEIVLQKITALEKEEKELANTPALLLAMQEIQKAEAAYRAANKKVETIAEEVGSCKRLVVAYNDRLNAVRTNIENAKQEYDALTNDYPSLVPKMMEMVEQNATLSEESLRRRRVALKKCEEVLLNLQRKYFTTVGNFNSASDVSQIPFFRQEMAKLENVEIEKAKDVMTKTGKELETAFIHDFMMELKESMDVAKSEINAINKELRTLRFGKDRYRFILTEKKDRKMFFRICDKLTERMMSVDLGSRAMVADEELEEDIKDFLDMVMESGSDEEMYTDYRNYFDYDMEIESENEKGEITKFLLSKKNKSASTGERQTPYLIILAASMMQCYPREANCARVAFIDEAFATLSAERINQLIQFFNANRFQMIYTAPAKGGDDISKHTDGLIALKQKNKYTWALDGLWKENN